MSDTTDPKVTGALGGKARAKALTKAQRAEIARMGAQARWSGPREIASGELKLIPDMPLACAVLDNQQRVLSTRGVSRAFSYKKTGTNNNGTGAPQPPPFLASAALKPFISDELIVLLNSPVVYRPLIGGRTAYGYDCTVFPKICTAIIAADRAGALKAQQQPLAAAAHAMTEALMGVAMVALIDEATGYQYDRDREALAAILSTYLGKELAAWCKTFPDEYYRGLCKLRKVAYDDQKRPQYFGHLTNELIYSRLAPGVRKELCERNPRLSSGRRKHRHHQWLSRDVGHRELEIHLGVTTAMMKTSKSYEELVEKLDHVAPRFGDTMPLLPFDQMQPPSSEQ